MVLTNLCKMCLYSVTVLHASKHTPHSTLEASASTLFNSHPHPLKKPAWFLELFKCATRVLSAWLDNLLIINLLICTPIKMQQFISLSK